MQRHSLAKLGRIVSFNSRNTHQQDKRHLQKTFKLKLQHMNYL